jgi:hypothetical protein
VAECPSRFSLVRMLAGDLQADEREELSRHLEQCPSCNRKLGEMQANVSLYAENKEQHLARLRSRLSRQPGRAPARLSWLRLAPVGGALAAAAAILLFLVPSLERKESRPPAADIRFKGSMAFEVVARRDSRQFRVQQGARLLPGDALRFVVTVGSPGYLTVFSIDASGSISAFYPDSDPAQDKAPLSLDRPGQHELEGSVILDRSRGDECLAVVFSSESFDRSRVHQRALASEWYRRKREPKRGELEPGLEAGVIWIKKGP